MVAQQTQPTVQVSRGRPKSPLSWESAKGGALRSNELGSGHRRKLAAMIPHNVAYITAGSRADNDYLLMPL